MSNQVEAAYRRTDLFERRIGLMNDWATFVGTLQEVELAGEVESEEMTDIALPVASDHSLRLAVSDRGGGFPQQRISITPMS